MNQEVMQRRLASSPEEENLVYQELFDEFKGMMIQVYREKLSNFYRLDDWFADALVLLITCIKRYQQANAKAKLSTYYMAALKNKANDHLRHRYTNKAKFYESMIPFLDPDPVRIEFQTNGDKPEDVFFLKEAIATMANKGGVNYHRAVNFILGQEPVPKLTIEQYRMVNQVQYRFKKRVVTHLRQP